jgi:hypothetical protein
MRCRGARRSPTCRKRRNACSFRLHFAFVGTSEAEATPNALKNTGDALIHSPVRKPPCDGDSSLSLSLSLSLSSIVTSQHRRHGPGRQVHGPQALHLHLHGPPQPALPAPHPPRRIKQNPVPTGRTPTLSRRQMICRGLAPPVTNFGIQTSFAIRASAPLDNLHGAAEGVEVELHSRQMSWRRGQPPQYLPIVLAIPACARRVGGGGREVG